MSKHLLIFVGLLLLNRFSPAQTFDAALADKLQHKLDSMLNADDIKGISASVFYPGQGIWQGTSGVSYGSVPITSDMEFGIGSNSKLFTAVILLKLAESNIITLDDSLHEWLPAFNNIDSNITVSQILNHTSGVADITAVPGYIDSILTDPNRVFTPYETVSWIGAPIFTAGTSWGYSNTNYILAGMLAERAAGQEIERVIRENILTPLRLDSIFFPVYDSILGTIAHPWQNNADINSTPRASLNSAAWTAGAIYSTAKDMVIWYRDLLDEQILNSNSIDKMTTFVGPADYGFGIRKMDVQGRTCYGHGGSIRGYRSMMLYDTESTAVVCVLINANPAPATLVAQKLLLTLVDEVTTGVAEYDDYAPEMELYPNPASEAIHLNIGCEQNLIKHGVYNMNGQRLEESSQEDISTSKLPVGRYFLVVETDKGVSVLKFIKQ